MRDYSALELEVEYFVFYIFLFASKHTAPMFVRVRREILLHLVSFYLHLYTQL